MAKSKRGFSFELRNSKQNRALGVASLRANLAKCGAFRWVCLKGVTNSKLNTALRSKGTAWALGVANLRVNSGLSKRVGKPLGFCFGGASQLIALGANAIA
ncbi:hypothetical protein A0Y76_06620 [Campylobacter upsaliensis]|nr:hypothetical protein [Campylobacter upsaliensis]